MAHGGLRHLPPHVGPPEGRAQAARSRGPGLPAGPPAAAADPAPGRRGVRSARRGLRPRRRLEPRAAVRVPPRRDPLQPPGAVPAADGHGGRGRGLRHRPGLPQGELPLAPLHPGPQEARARAGAAGAGGRGRVAVLGGDHPRGGALEGGPGGAAHRPLPLHLRHDGLRARVPRLVAGGAAGGHDAGGARGAGAPVQPAPGPAGRVGRRGGRCAGPTGPAQTGAGREHLRRPVFLGPRRRACAVPAGPPSRRPLAVGESPTDGCRGGLALRDGGLRATDGGPSGGVLVPEAGGCCCVPLLFCVKTTVTRRRRAL
mmetsp:Transcript_42458/g.71733  ORF Transcript_42458/g.71733 Transcript_42458/m.71733 type:complete len:314 (+) Transcript_42458:349-1290(+)